MAEIKFEVQLPDGLVQEFLQHTRDFEVEHMNETEFRMWIDAPNLTVEETKAIFENIQPPYPFKAFIPR
jgi:hypothetical protein